MDFIRFFVLNRLFGTVLQTLGIAPAQIANQYVFFARMHPDRPVHTGLLTSTTADALFLVDLHGPGLFIPAQSVDFGWTGIDTGSIFTLMTVKRTVHLFEMIPHDADAGLGRVYHPEVGQAAPLFAHSAAGAFSLIDIQDFSVHGTPSRLQALTGAVSLACLRLLGINSAQTTMSIIFN